MEPEREKEKEMETRECERERVEKRKREIQVIVNDAIGLGNKRGELSLLNNTKSLLYNFLSILDFPFSFLFSFSFFNADSYINTIQSLKMLKIQE